jgi:phosphate transport system substrate-binding protein
MKRKAIALVAIAALALAVALGATAKPAKQTATVLNGAGSTFVSPLVSVWTPALGSAFDYTIQYGAVGSGAGIQAIQSRQVDFGASDAPMTPDQFAACNGCVQIPWALAGTAIPYNVQGNTKPLQLSGDVIAKIYMGEIKSWDDPQIQKLNPGQHLPTLAITPVYRTGNSGTTYNFTDFLASTSTEWNTKLGVGQAVAWPTGIGVSGSAGVAGAIQNTPGAIGYVDTAFAVANHLHFAAIQNAANKFIFPSIRNVLAAGAAVRSVQENNELHIVNPPKSNPTAYPIATFTYVIVPTSSKNGNALRKMIFWALTQGQASKYTAKLWFAPIPRVVLVAAEKTLTQVKQST